MLLDYLPASLPPSFCQMCRRDPFVFPTLLFSSARIDSNFRIVFVVCEECRKVPECEYCFCEDLPDKTVMFLTVGPHDKAYAIR